MSEKLTLYVCHVDQTGPKLHACRRANDALREAGHDFEKVVWGKGKPLGFFTTGKRPELKEMSGQEKLPVLKLADGSTVNGGAAIAEWAKANAPSSATAGAG